MRFTTEFQHFSMALREVNTQTTMRFTTEFQHFSMALREVNAEIISDSMQVENISTILWYAT